MSAYLSAVLAANPTHYWRLADPTGAVANDIGSAAPFPLFAASGPGRDVCGASGPNSDGGSGIFDASVWLDSITNVAFTPPITFEWVLWVQGPRADGVQSFPIGLGDDLNGPFHNELGSGIYALNFNGAASVPLAPPSAQRWHHFAFTYAAAAATANYYIDGVLQPVIASGVFGAFSAHLVVGRRITGGGSFWIGALSEIAIYPTVLSAATLANHAAAIDDPTAPPVNRASGPQNGQIGNTVYTDLLHQILQSVRKIYG